MEVIVPEELFKTQADGEFPSSNKLLKLIAPSLKERGIKNTNIIQSAVLLNMDKDRNCIVSAPTSSGKTLIAEFLIQQTLMEGGMAICLFPLKALSQEKYNKWSKPPHHFAEKQIEIVTGDYQMTNARIEKLKTADIVIMTSEMLDHKVRLGSGKSTDWLKRASLLVVDEAHLMTYPKRGSSLECGILRFGTVIPNAKIVLLSATMANVADLGEWITSLNGKECTLIKSQYQPVPLIKQVCLAPDFGQAVAQVVKSPGMTPCLVFVHTKKMGHTIQKLMEIKGINSKFHCADLEMGARAEIEDQFQSKELPVLISTSTLAYGIDYGARAVIICGVKRGPQTVHPIDIQQEMGRAGRLGKDKEGNAYLLVDSQNHLQEWANIIAKPLTIQSALADIGELIPHIIAEIHREIIKNAEDLRQWYSKTFAGRTEIMDLESAELLLKDMKWRKAVKIENGVVSLTWAGKVALFFYLHPFDVHSLLMSLPVVNKIIKNNPDIDALALLALAYTQMPMMNHIWVPDTGKGNVYSLVNRFGTQLAKFDLSKQPMTIAELLLDWGSGIIPRSMITPLYSFLSDVERWGAAIASLSTIYEELPGAGDDWLKISNIRLKYGVSKKKAVLCQIAEVGKARADKLYDAGMTTIEDVVKCKEEVQKLFSKNIASKIIESARALSQK